MSQSNHSSRRNFLKALGLGAGFATAPSVIRAATTRPHVIVVGGGFAGATAAKYLRHWSTSVDVTLIEPNANYYSPILSNLVLNGQRNLSQLSFNYATLAQQYGISVVQDRVNTIDSANHTVTLAGGNTLAYDRLILAPGIDFMTVPGLDSDLIPHAWQSGPQIQQLQQQLAAMPAGGTFVMTIPKAPYRCPPGPYERACVVADYLKRHNPTAKLIVLDANAGIIVEQETFNHAFTVTYAGIVEYLPDSELQAVDSVQRIATTNYGEYAADVLNVIPPHQAGSLIHQAGLANDASGRWAVINPLSYESTAAADIHVIGDSQATGQPKAGHIANAEAKVCADAILRLLAGGQPYAAPMTNSACYSPISADTASWLTAVFAYNSASGAMELVPQSLGASQGASRSNYNKMFDWADSLFGDTFA
ncbi:FAD-dependent oxidoreductase [Leucothrix pacifica]|uniref:Pyridine nucleotide-disulfide oxidoreductase n=1 Tax=Leucothrix pacifica TaxID=1247513 RepID=A0A317CEP0_9GAMM|nr:FAD/NAD(P)-binding oxidoreductase [Leucothrix pacifica]PWQ96561.1 pyridine nucleotide-disulfide oxidoreductase [Leucothrix pacifica]